MVLFFLREQVIFKEILEFFNQFFNLDKNCMDYEGKCYPLRANSSFGLDFDCLFEKMCKCVLQHQTLNSYFQLTAYLYPFTIEFSILAGLLYFNFHVHMLFHNSLIFSWSMVCNVEQNWKSC